MVHEILPPKLGICGRHRQVTLVGTNKHFWCRCRGWHRVEYIDNSCEQNWDWYSHAKQANLALFSCLCWYENRIVYDFHFDPESLLRRTRARLVSPRRPLSAAEPVIALSSASQAMAQKTLHDYSASSANQVPPGPRSTRENFEIKTGLITRVQGSLNTKCLPVLLTFHTVYITFSS